jgi:hypothetical protein
MKTIKDKRGIVLYTLLGVLVIVSIFAFSIDSYTRKKLSQSRHLHQRAKTTILAQSVLNYAVARLNEELESEDSDLFSFFSSEAVEPGDELPVTLPLLPDILQDYSDATADCSIIVKTIQQLREEENLATTGFDPFEKELVVTITAEVTSNGFYCKLSEDRPIRLINLLPDILGKFTFYVKNLDDSQSLNCFANHIDGYTDSAFSQSPNCIPVILKNGGELDFAASEINDPDSWQKRGYIFIGGDSVDINLTGGNFEAYGELFHFYAMDQSSGIPGYYTMFPPSFFAAPPDFTQTWPQSLNSGPDFASEFAYILKHVVAGFYTTQDNGGGMNYDQRLAVSFPDSDSTSETRMRSSSLNLFGTRSNPSPTLVLGNVNRCYADFCGIVVDVDLDGQRDAVVDYVRETDEPVGNLPMPESSIEASSNGSLAPGTLIQLDNGLINYSNMFASDFEYQENMCAIISEPYLRSHDYLYFRAEDNFFPETSCFGESVADYQHKFSLKFDSEVFADRDFYKDGYPQDYPVDGLNDKISYRINDFAEFLERFYDSDNNRLHLGITVSIENSQGQPVELPDGLSLTRGGLLLVENGDIEVGAIGLSDPDEVLTIVALQGNIILNLSSGQPVCANLIALNGTVKNNTPNRGLDLNGTLAVNNYNPIEFKAGGRILYNNLNDPSGKNYDYYYRCFVADYSDNIKKTF